MHIIVNTLKLSFLLRWCVGLA